MYKRALGLTMLLGLSPLAVQAGPFSYTFIDASYGYADIDGPADGEGYRVDGSLAVHPNIFLWAGWQEFDLDIGGGGDDVDASFLTGGVGVNIPLGALPIDLVGRVGYTNQDFSPGPSEEGFTVGGGVRVDLALVELEGGVNYYDVDDVGFDDFTIDAAARFYLLPFLALQASAEFDEDFDNAIYLGGVRFEFGGLNPAE